MVGALLFGHAGGSEKHVPRQPGIGVNEQNPLAFGPAGADMAGVALAQPSLWQNVNAHDLQPRILLRQLLQDFTRSISGAIIHDDQFQLDATLGQQTANSLLDTRFLVPRGDDYGAFDSANGR